MQAIVVFSKSEKVRPFRYYMQKLVLELLEWASRVVLRFELSKKATCTLKQRALEKSDRQSKK